MIHLIFIASFIVLQALFLLLYRRAYRVGNVFSYSGFSFKRAALFSCVVGGVTFVLGLVLTQRLAAVTEQMLRHDGTLYMKALKVGVGSELERVDDAVAILSGSPAVQDFLAQPDSGGFYAVQQTLHRYGSRQGASVCYLIDTIGLTVASTNEESPASFIGKNYAFRPYFIAARAGRAVSYFAQGVTSSVRGYYSSAPVRDSLERVIGVAVIKKELQTIDMLFRAVFPTFLVDENGIVFAAADTAALLRPLFASSAQLLRTINSTRQVETLRSEPVFASPQGSAIGRYGSSLAMLVADTVGSGGWSLYTLVPAWLVQRTLLMGYGATMVAALFLLIVVALVSLLRSRVWINSLVTSEKRFRTIFESAPEAILIVEPYHGAIVGANPRATQLLGIAYELLWAQSIQDVVRLADSSKVLKPPFLESLRGVFELTHHNGQLRTVSISSAEMVYQGQKALLLFLGDMTELLQAQQALAESENRFRELAESLPEMVYEMDMQGRVTFTNRVGYLLSGFTPQDLLRGVNIVELLVPEDRDRALQSTQQILSGNQSQNNEYMAQDVRGRRFPVIVHSSRIVKDGKTVGMRGIIMDISDRKRVEEELRRSDKLEALGSLAGGIAHDFNNILTAVWSGASYLKAVFGSNTEARQTLDELEHAISRGKDLTTQLITYAKGGAPIKTRASLLDITRETAGFILSGSPVNSVVSAQEQLWGVEVDSAQISQVIQNLILNAAQAMSQGGTVRIHLENFVNPPESTIPLAAGKYVRMTVTDTGKGIADEHRDRIFDPFFTTRTNGTGLGLSTTLSIMRRHGGHIDFTSQEGKGSQFFIYLPASSIAPVSVPPLAVTIRSGSGRVLLMDDDRIIRVMGEKLLKFLGYTTALAAGGSEALALYKEALAQGQRFDCVILDLTVPGDLGGLQTLQQLLELDSSVAALVSSGYSDDPVMSNFADYGFKGCIRKPYDVQQLSEALARIVATGS